MSSSTIQSYANSVFERKSRLQLYLQEPMQALSERLVSTLHDRAIMDETLQNAFTTHPVLKRCDRFYVLDQQGVQISSRVSRQHIDLGAYGQDLSQRPYLSGKVPDTGIMLSPVYINKLDGHSCMSAVAKIKHATNQSLGFVVADFSLLSLPSDDETTEDRRVWLQIKGDPSIRGTLFMQSRTHSLMDENIDEVIGIVDELLLERGVFHAKLHFSSSRATLWLYNDPYHYRVHALPELMDACLAYPPRAYPQEASVAKAQIEQVFQQFKALRFVDDTVYLRSASLNIINGMVGLNFSCDGSHYIPVEQFLQEGEMFWLGVKGH